MIRRAARAGGRRVTRRRAPPRHLARPGPAWTDTKRALALVLLGIALVTLFINITELGMAEIVYPHAVPGFLRLTPMGGDEYRLVVVGEPYDFNVSHLRAVATRLGIRLASIRAA